MSDIILKCDNLKKSFTQSSDKSSSDKLEVLKDINLEVRAGEQIAIVGSSGSGKTTLLNSMAGLDSPSSGEVLINNVSIFKLSDRKKSELRNNFVGFIYQFHHLLPELTAIENVMMPLLISGADKKTSTQKSKDILDKVGLSHRLNHKPGLLSGGEKQRVAIARALVMDPKCVFADEPTGNLDQDTAKTVISLLQDLNKNLNTSLIVVTHDMEIAKKMDRIFEMKSGCLIENKKIKN